MLANGSRATRSALLRYAVPDLHAPWVAELHSSHGTLARSRRRKLCIRLTSGAAVDAAPASTCVHMTHDVIYCPLEPSAHGSANGLVPCGTLRNTGDILEGDAGGSGVLG